jgi:hypothetical protein
MGRSVETGEEASGYTRHSSAGSMDHPPSSERDAERRPAWIAREMVDLLTPAVRAACLRERAIGVASCLTDRGRQFPGGTVNRALSATWLLTA